MAISWVENESSTAITNQYWFARINHGRRRVHELHLHDNAPRNKHNNNEDDDDIHDNMETTWQQRQWWLQDSAQKQATH